MERDASIDVAKGIMIVLLVLHHIVDCSLRVPIENGALNLMHFLQRPIALCYFMQAFFLITGMCSSFNGSFREFLIKQVRTLLIPGVVFSLAYHLYNCHGCGLSAWFRWNLTRGGAYWFLTAMFVGKVFYYWLKRLVPVKSVLIGILLALSFSGTLLANAKVFSNWWWHWQIFDLTLYIAIGNILKEIVKQDRYGVMALILYCALLSLGSCIWGLGNLPYVTAGFGTTVPGWPMHVMLALSGSVAVLWIARRLPHPAWLCYLGRQSLIVYMTQGASLQFLVGVFSSVLNNGRPSTSLIAICVIAVATCAVAAVVAYLIEVTPMRMIMGRGVKRKA